MLKRRSVVSQFRHRSLALPLALAIVMGMTWTATSANASDSLAPQTAARLAAGQSDVKIVCFGDSVTGIYYHTGGRRAYPEMLGVALRKLDSKARPVIINAGISGNNTRAALKRIDKDVLQHKPQLVTVMFCLNDVVGVPPDEYAGNLTKIIEQCRGVGAEVLLCTPNGVFETGGRPIAKIKDYMAVMKRVGEEQRVPVVDVFHAYTDVERNSPAEFSLLMSDEIHPNMAGHKLDAELIALAITGRKVSLADVPPMTPSLPKTAALLKAGQPVTILAMPPFDTIIGPAIAEVVPQAMVNVVSWPTAGQTLAEIEAVSKKVREKKVDFVLVAVPASATAPSREAYQRSYSWILNWSLSFGVQEWDCIAVPASVFTPKLSPEEQENDRLAGRLIFAQDLGTFGHKPDSPLPLQELVVRWLRQQLK